MIKMFLVDGSVIISIAFPGHTAGHQALFLNRKESGPTLRWYHFKQKNRTDKSK
jgi:hypothetical protein